MSRSFSTIPPDGPHAVHLQHAIMAFTKVPGRIGLFWQYKSDTLAAALTQLCRSLVSEMLSPPSKMKLCKAIGKIVDEQIRPDHERFAEQLMDQRLTTLKSVYDPAVYNLDALACQDCAQARLGHCDIASQSPGVHCTNCVLWRKETCNCVSGVIEPLIDGLIKLAEQHDGQPLAAPKDFSALPEDKRQQHTREFCERQFGPWFEWPESHPPSPQIPEAIRNNVLGLAGKEMREKVKARMQQEEAKRQERRTFFVNRAREGQGSETAGSAGSKKRATLPRIKLERGSDERAAFAPMPLSQADPLTIAELRSQAMGTDEIPARKIEEQQMAPAMPRKRKPE